MKVHIRSEKLRFKLFKFSLLVLLIFTLVLTTSFMYSVVGEDDSSAEETELEEEIGEIELVEHEAENFIIHYPQEWQLETQKDETGEIVVISKDFSGYPNINVLQQEDVDMSLEEYLELSLEQLQEFADFELKEQKEVELVGLEARQIEFVHDEMHETLRQRQIMMVEAGKAYVLTHTDFAGNFQDDLPLFSYLVENKFSLREDSE